MHVRALANRTGGNKIAIASTGVTKQSLAELVVDHGDLAWIWDICLIPWKQVRGALKMVGNVVDYAASMLVGAEFEGVEPVLKIVASDLQIILSEIEHLSVLDLCSSGQRFEIRPWKRPEWLCAGAAGINLLGSRRPVYRTCQ